MKRPSRSKKNPIDRENATGVSGYLQYYLASSLQQLSVMSPFPDCNMHIVASEDFHRSAIYPSDTLEMCLRNSTSGLAQTAD